MRHLNAGRKLGVTPDHRRALLRSLTLALIERDQIQITPARAKALRGYADHVITLAKRGDLHGRRQIVRLLGSSETNTPGNNRVRNAVERVYSDLAPRFKTRPGGYTQIFKLVDRRPGDNAEQVIMRYIPSPDEKKKTTGGEKGKKEAKKKTETPKIEAAASDKDTKKKASRPVEDKAVDKKTKKTK